MKFFRSSSKKKWSHQTRKTRKSTNTGPMSTTRFENFLLLMCPGLNSSVGKVLAFGAEGQRLNSKVGPKNFINWNEEMNPKVNKKKNKNYSNSLACSSWQKYLGVTFSDMGTISQSESPVTINKKLFDKKINKANVDAAGAKKLQRDLPDSPLAGFSFPGGSSSSSSLEPDSSSSSSSSSLSNSFVRFRFRPFDSPASDFLSSDALSASSFLSASDRAASLDSGFFSSSSTLSRA